jgi:hypothetical protein
MGNGESNAGKSHFAQKAYEDLGGGKGTEGQLQNVVGKFAYDYMMSVPSTEAVRVYQARGWEHHPDWQKVKTYYADEAYKRVTIAQNEASDEDKKEFSAHAVYDTIMREPIDKHYAMYTRKQRELANLLANLPRKKASAATRKKAQLAKRLGRHDVGDALAAGYAPVYKKTSIPVGTWGCLIPGDDARAMTKSRADVEAMCDANVKCRGYYADQDDSWFIATDKDPEQCTVRGRESYSSFYAKATERSPVGTGAP